MLAGEGKSGTVSHNKQESREVRGPDSVPLG